MEQLARTVSMGLSCRIHRAFGHLSQTQGLDGAEQSQELAFITAMGSFQLGIFYDSMILAFIKVLLPII